MKFVKVMFPIMLILFVVILLFNACADAFKNPIDLNIHTNLYPTCGVIVEINYENDEVTVEDFNNNLWIFKGAEDWAEGDICAMIMNNEGTPEIYDDIIIQTKYCGWKY